MRRKIGRKNKKPVLILFLMFIFILAGVVMADKQFAPIIKAIAHEQAHNLAIKSLEEAVQKQLQGRSDLYDYQNLMYIEKDESGRIVLMIPNTMQVNSLISALVLETEESMGKMTQEELKIPLGVLTGTSLFATKGPALNINVVPIGLIGVEVKDEFVSAGINQTHHKIWLNLEYRLSLAIPFDSEIITASTSVLLTEGIIVGPIPETYVQIGLNN